MNPRSRAHARPLSAFPFRLSLLLFFLSALHLDGAASFFDPNSDRDALPTVPAGFAVSVFAREPLVRQPCSMAFDAKGRLCIGLGPQYRNPKPDTPGDSVVLVLDSDGDGQADRTRTFATGFNAIQGLAWHGRDLWVANAPDLTLVRDLDGDDEADEYVRVYTDLGNLEHGLHGLNWAPDGWLYMSKGNSKGLTQPGRIAPKPFRDLWGVTAPPDAPEFPTPQTFRRAAYRHAYHDPEDDWGREGGVLRCQDGGRNLEIVARGFRNPWDITFDTGFNWLGTDNDQTTGDRVFMPFFGGHFGWNHPWSAHWSDTEHAPTAPVSGPLFEGSGTGIVFGDSPQFPPSHRGVFFINDWLRKTTFVWRPHWDGALLRPAGGDWEPFVQGGRALFRPTDVEVGPDGALWILGWSSGYGAEYRNGEMTNEGRVFRVAWTNAASARWNTPKRTRPLAEWSVTELLDDCNGPLPVWRIDAQDELVRRGPAVKSALLATLAAGSPDEGRETWTLWTLGRLAPLDQTIDDWFASKVGDAATTLNLRVQALRILAHRIRAAGDARTLPASAVAALRSPEGRLRLEAVQAIGQTGEKQHAPALLELVAAEGDRTTFYAAWQTLRRLLQRTELNHLLADPRGGVRRAALLALLEDHALPADAVARYAADPDAGVRQIAGLWRQKAADGSDQAVVRGRPLNATGVEDPARQAPDAQRREMFVSGVKGRSAGVYRLQPGALQARVRPYTDRAYTLREVPPALERADFIQTANNDDGSRGEDWLVFDSLLPVRVYVAFDTRLPSPPKWIRDKFQKSELRIAADHWLFQLYSREFPAGQVVLGGNTDDGRPGGKGNYIVVLQALALAPPTRPPTIDEAVALLPQANPARGEALFHHPAGAGCFNCHQAAGRGNPFAPDLQTLGDRATARHIIQSMLEPNAVITEGYHLQVVETSDGEFSGTLLEESGLSLTLGLATGQRQVIPKSKIVSRQTAASSAMPGYETLLNGSQVSDLAAFLLAQKAPTKRATAGVAEQEPNPRTRPSTDNDFAVEEKAGRLLITHSRRPVAEFVFRDETILRPYFANIHAPGGRKVTRNHPPVAGQDATDHDTMHPGIWLGFGDISGTDFWRNKGRIEHVRFIEGPAVKNGTLTFATESRLLTPAQKPLGALTNRFTLGARTNAWWLEWEATFRSDDGEFTFGDQEEMGFGARVATAITEKSGGVITSSTGGKTAKDTWGQAADWCDYSGTMDGQRVGLTLLADPSNFRPSWWHNRDYGVFVANPFGRAAMKQGAPSAVTVKRGETFQLRFGAVIHDGADFSNAAAFEHFLRR